VKLPLGDAMILHIETRANWRLLLVSTLLLQSCSSISEIPDSVDFPKGKSTSAGNVTAYESIESNHFHALTAALHSKHIGEASWYGPGFNGRKTASGELFDQKKFTAAHKTAPLGTVARVTNLSNEQTVDVEINDRGPYVGGRIIDLSHAAAKALGMIDGGIARVRIEFLDEDVAMPEAVNR